MVGIGWLKRLFGGMDRSEAASERIATALEGMAADLEAARDALRQRLGIEEQSAGEPLAIEGTRNGKRKSAAV